MAELERVTPGSPAMALDASSACGGVRVVLGMFHRT